VGCYWAFSPSGRPIVLPDANATLTAVAGLLVGHYTNPAALTGCTAVLCPQGAVAGVCTRGGAPGTRETDALRPGTLTPTIHGVLLTGGSAFGLDAAGGVMRWLEAQGAGFATAVAHRGIPLDKLQTVLGHSDVTTTRMYVQTDSHEVALEMRDW